jgi:hypothetical protein
VTNTFYLDASALAKRYIPERGSAQVDAIFDAVPRARTRVLNVSLGEVVSVLVRRRNTNSVSQIAFEHALADFRTEIVYASEVRVSVTSRLITASFPSSLSTRSTRAMP